jgi:hypothetical protein
MILQFSIDTNPSITSAISEEAQAVWHDDDDEKVMVDLDHTARLKRLKYSKKNVGKSKVTGVQLSELLKERSVNTHI